MKELNFKLIGYTLGILFFAVGLIPNYQVFFVVSVCCLFKIVGNKSEITNGVVFIVGTVFSTLLLLDAAYAVLMFIGFSFFVNSISIFFNRENRNLLPQWWALIKNKFQIRNLKTKQDFQSFWKTITFSGDEYDGQWGDLVQLYQILKEEGVPFWERIVEVVINVFSLIFQLIKDKITMILRRQTHRNE